MHETVIDPTTRADAITCASFHIDGDRKRLIDDSLIGEISDHRGHGNAFEHHDRPPAGGPCLDHGRWLGNHWLQGSDGTITVRGFQDAARWHAIRVELDSIK